MHELRNRVYIRQRLSNRDESRVWDLLLAEYQAIKESGQHFWSLAIALATLGVSAVGGAVVLMTFTCSREVASACFPKEGWLVVPLVPYAICVMFVQQAALQNARSTYERALERRVRELTQTHIEPFPPTRLAVPSFEELTSQMFDPRNLARGSLLVWVSAIPYLVLLLTFAAVCAVALTQLPHGSIISWFLTGYITLFAILVYGVICALSPSLLTKLIAASPVAAQEPKTSPISL